MLSDATVETIPTLVELSTSNDANGENSISTASVISPYNNNDSNDWRLWCRLCAKDDPQGRINVFFNDEQQNETVRSATANYALASTTDINLSAAIGKFFCVEIKRDEYLPKMLCNECFSLVMSLVSFSERVDKVQQMFGILLNSALLEMPTIDLNAMSLKYGLLGEEREHIIHQLPEVHYSESNPEINDIDGCMFGNETLVATTTTRTITNSLVQQQQHQQQQSQQQSQLCSGIQINKEGIPDNLNGKDIEQDIVLVYDDGHYYNDDYSESSPQIMLSNNSLQINEPENLSLEQTPKKLRKLRRKRKLEADDNEAKVNEVTHDGEDDDDVDDDDDDDDEDYDDEDSADNDNDYDDDYEIDDEENDDSDYTATDEASSIVNVANGEKLHEKIYLTPKQRKDVSCPHCNKKFCTHTVMQTHIKHIHMNERPFICEECGVAMRTKSALNAHMLTHSDNEPFECEVCEKSFKNQIRLKKHMETHSPNKHICAECGMQLNSRATLNRHRLVHSDENQHKCDHCGRAFKRAKALKNHLILHTGLKPYSCDFCDRTFANGSNCRSHKKKAHPEELAALEAAGGGKTYTRNIPKLEALKAVTKATENLTTVVSKHSGCFALRKRPKPWVKKIVMDI